MRKCVKKMNIGGVNVYRDLLVLIFLEIIELVARHPVRDLEVGVAAPAHVEVGRVSQLDTRQFHRWVVKVEVLARLLELVEETPVVTDVALLRRNGHAFVVFGACLAEKVERGGGLDGTQT